MVIVYNCERNITLLVYGCKADFIQILKNKLESSSDKKIIMKNFLTLINNIFSNLNWNSG